MKIFNVTPFLIPIILFTASFNTRANAQEMPDFTGQVFPANNALNSPVDSLPVHPNSSFFISKIGAGTSIHPDFGTDYEGYPMGMSYNIVGANQSKVRFTFEYESDTIAYPIPIPPLVEGLNSYTDDNDGDRHIIVIDTSAKKLYETWYTWPPGHSMPEPEYWGTFPPQNPFDWWAGSGAIFDLTSNALRPDGGTSADAAGLPIFPLLVRYDEVERALASDGVIHHAIRFTANVTQQAYIWPARHQASSNTDTTRPPMGLRFRLKANTDITGFTPRMQVILRTMKKFGLIVADNGGNWFFQGSHDDRWDDDELNSLKNLHGSDFEAVDISGWMNRPGFDINSAAVPPPLGTNVKSNPANHIPQNFILYQNYPNPFNPQTEIGYFLPSYCKIKLAVYDLVGREIKILTDGYQAPGEHKIIFNGESFSSGIYFYRLIAGNFILTRKMILLK